MQKLNKIEIEWIINELDKAAANLKQQAMKKRKRWTCSRIYEFKIRAVCQHCG